MEPFRGILLGLFFMAVGMALDLTVIAENWQLIAISVTALMVVKGLIIYGVAIKTKVGHAEALERTVLMAQGASSPLLSCIPPDLRSPRATGKRDSERLSSSRWP